MFHPDTQILLANGRFEYVKHIKIGDMLLSPNEEPVAVVDKTLASRLLYDIKPKRGLPLIVGEDQKIMMKVISLPKHEYDVPFKEIRIKWLSREPVQVNQKQFNQTQGQQFKTLKTLAEAEYQNILVGSNVLQVGDVVELELHHYLSLEETTQQLFQLHRPGIEFPDKKCPIDPYILGRCLLECVTQKYVKRYLRSLDMFPDEADTILNYLESEDLFKNKRVPLEYLTNSRNVRRLVLAGILEVGGKTEFESLTPIIESRNKNLALDIAQLANSLGILTYLEKKVIVRSGEWLWSRNIEEVNYRLHFNCDNIFEKICRSELCHDLVCHGANLFNVTAKWKMDAIHLQLSDSRVIITDDFTQVMGNVKPFQPNTKT